MHDIGGVDVGADFSSGGGGLDQASHGARDAAGRVGEQRGIGGEQQAQAGGEAALGGDVVDEALHPELQRDIG
ncbi:MAG: hypothetical protein EOR62_29805, partial [Mesorhizobium sp.]